MIESKIDMYLRHAAPVHKGFLKLNNLLMWVIFYKVDIIKNLNSYIWQNLYNIF